MPPAEASGFWGLIAALGVLAAGGAALFLVRPARRIAVRGGWRELFDQVDMLVEGGARVRGLLVEVPESGARVRLMRSRDHLELQVPVPRDGDARTENRFRTLCDRWASPAWTQVDPRLGRYEAVRLPPQADVIETRLEQVLGVVHDARVDSEFRVIVLR